MITVVYDKELGNFELTFPFNKTDLSIVKGLPVRTYDKKERKWNVPELVVETLDNQKGLHWEKSAIDRKNFIKKALKLLIKNKFTYEINTEVDKGAKEAYLRPYQQIGVNFLALAKKAILADDMGLGKTIQAIQALIDLDVKRTLIICPATLKLNWKNEFIKHFEMESIIVEGNSEKRKSIWADKGDGFYITNYDILLRDWQDIPKKWDAIICDEAVYLKNYKAQRTKLSKKLVSDVKIALSGMPIENNLMEFYSIFEWVRPNILPSFSRFKQRYIDYDFSGEIKGYKNLHELHTITSPYILRREKNKVLTDLPPKIYSDFPLELDYKTEKAYVAICKEFLDWLRNETGANWQSSVLVNLIRLRQFVEFPQNVGFDNLPSVKMNWLKDTYSNLDKIVVFVNFKNSVELLREEFKTKFIITGDTPVKDRVPLVDEFNLADKGMFILTDAGKFGLNITGSSYVTNLGYSYNPATMLQREDRLHRIGQKNTVNVINPYIVSTIDQGIRSVYMRRMAEAKSFMDGSEQESVKRLTKKDFEKIILGGLDNVNN